MRFLRILPAVWAMISCPFSSFTRKVALGSNSETVPGNSSNSSLAIRVLGWGDFGQAGGCTWPNENQALSASRLEIKREDQGEKPPGGVEIGLDLAFEAFAQKLRAFVVHAAPSHVDGFDALGYSLADGRIIALADLVIVLQHAAERRHGQQHAPMLALILQPHIENQARLRVGEDQMIGAARRTLRCEIILFQEIVDRDLL